MSPEAVVLKYARVEPPPRIKNLSNSPLFVNGAANVSKNLLCNAEIGINKRKRSSLCIFNQRNQTVHTMSFLRSVHNFRKDTSYKVSTFTNSEHRWSFECDHMAKKMEILNLALELENRA